ncbi:MAG: type II toxin-antitoxin system HicA family toxin [Oscillospiraceae bacterium]|nr:type II toxin-antitoxin system HicA family toxin [Oscillospiraceae bacterium]
MKFNEIERIILKDGWYHIKTVGSHYHYKHPTKKGKATIPFSRKDLNPDTVKSILKQAGLR